VLVVIRNNAGGQDKVISLNRGCWSLYRGGQDKVVSVKWGCWGGGSIVLLRLHRWEATYLDPRQHGDVLVDVPHRYVCHCV
jgi:hypothetical protein